MSERVGLQFAALIAVLLLTAPAGRLPGQDLRRRAKKPGDRVFGPIGRVIYQVCRVVRQRAAVGTAVRACTVLCPSCLYGIARFAVQSDGQTGGDDHVAFNAAVSFMTNTNWQSYSGEATMSTQMTGLSICASRRHVRAGG